MKTTYFLVVLIALFLLTNLTGVSIAGPINIPGLFNTGVDDQGARLPNGSLEQHYVLTGVASPAYVPDVVAWSLSGTWYSPAANAQWISTQVRDAPAGDYVYTLTFDLSEFDPAAVIISGQWASDNSSAIYLNGIKTQYGIDRWGFLSVHDFSINSGLLRTINTLEFHVNNEYDGPGGNNPTGLLVQNLIATPEPATLLMLTLGGLILRKRKA
jgi:hypothetical protein